MSYAFRTFIVPAAHADLARALCALEPGGAGMFTTPLSTSGVEPTTHYVSTGFVPGALGAASPYAEWEQDQDGKWIRTSYEPGRPEAVLAAAQAADPPIPCTLEEIEHLFTSSDVTSQDPWVAFSRLELKIVQFKEPEQ